MIEGMVKINGEDDLFYDSINKEYRYRMHCPYCGKLSGCWCFGQNLEDVPIFEDQHPAAYCSNLHFVLNTKIVQEIANDLGITIKPTMEEWNALKIVKELMGEYDFEPLTGDYCIR